MMGIHFTV
jgi:hypothetical protein